MQEVKKSPAAAPAIVPVQFHASQEDKHPKHVFITDIVNASLLGRPLSKILYPGEYSLLNGGRVWVVRTAFVDQTAFEREVRLDHRFQRLADIPVHRSRLHGRRQQHLAGMG